DLVYGPVMDGAPGFTCLAYSPGGKEVLAAGPLAQIYRWKVGSRELQTRSRPAVFRHGSGHPVTALAYSCDGPVAASGGVVRRVCVFDAAVGKTRPAPVATLEGLGGTVYSLALSTGGQRALAGGRNGRACLWDLGAEPPASMAAPTQTLQWHEKDAT